MPAYEPRHRIGLRWYSFHNVMIEIHHIAPSKYITSAADIAMVDSGTIIISIHAAPKTCGRHGESKRNYQVPNLWRTQWHTQLLSLATWTCIVCTHSQRHACCLRTRLKLLNATSAVGENSGGAIVDRFHTALKVHVPYERRVKNTTCHGCCERNLAHCCIVVDGEYTLSKASGKHKSAVCCSCHRKNYL